MAIQYLWNPITRYLQHTYGGKKAFLLAAWHLIRSGLGAFAAYRRIDWHRVSRVIFICKGNICRSAFAGKQFRFVGVEVTSAGLDADSGKPADPMAIRMARCFGVDLAHHRSTHVSLLELGDSDLLVAFEPGQAEQLRRLPACGSGVQVTLLGLWCPWPGMAYIQDPYGLAEPYFEACFSRIERGLEGLRLRFSDARAARERTT